MWICTFVGDVAGESVREDSHLLSGFKSEKLGALSPMAPSVSCAESSPCLAGRSRSRGKGGRWVLVRVGSELGHGRSVAL